MSNIKNLSRRSVLAAGLAACAAFVVPAAETATNARRRGSGRIIRTLLTDVASNSLRGPTLFHEHLSMKYPPQAREHFTDDIDLMTEEVRAAGKDGIACIVDGGHPDMSRNLDALKRIASKSGVHIVASGGFYMQRTYPSDIATRSTEEIAAQLVREARDQRLGAFGEIGQQGGELTADERKVFEAVAKAQKETGLPIFTHNAYTGSRQVQTPVPPEAALRQLDVLEGAGGDPAHIAIGHMCCLDDPEVRIAIRIAQRGAYIGFDRVTIRSIISDEKRVAMVMKLVEAGYADKLLIASDFAVAASLKQRGGPGIAQAWTVFAPMLRKAGLSNADVREIMIENPKRFLAFEPTKT